MTRELDIYFQDGTLDEDTKVGFGFQSKTYFVDNKETRTTRDNSQDILNVLNVVTGNSSYTKRNEELTLITTELLEEMATSSEPVTSISITIEDTGAYIKSLVFNDYDYYSMILDCPLHKLYILNTDKVFDLSLTVDPNIYIDDLIYFYTETLGLSVPRSLMEAVYNRLTLFYKPIIYNEINKRESVEDPLYYTNRIFLSNYSGEGELTYTLTVNPDNKFNEEVLGDIIGLSADDKTISLINTQSAFNTFPTTEDLSVIIKGLNMKIGSDTYSADGTYTMVMKDTVNKSFIVQEAIPFDYSFPYPKIYREYPRTNITSVDNTTASIVVSSVSGFSIGDTLTIYGSYNNVNDGDYTIIGINTTTKTISLDTVPPVPLTANCGRAIKLTYVGEAKLIRDELDSSSGNYYRIVTLKEQGTLALQGGDYVKIGDYWDNLVDMTWGGAYTTQFDMLVGQANIPPVQPYDPASLYPKLYYNQLNTTVNINITSSELDKLPTGEFNVDDNNQCRNYISLGGVSSYVASLTTLNQACKKFSDTRITSNIAGIPVTVKGLYSEFYS